MATPAAELDLPFYEGRDVNQAATLPEGHWLARNMFGYAVWHYDDAIGILRDKRWHNAAGRIPELMGITNEEFLSRQGVSILSAEGEMHTRLRRLVAPAFSPRSADRLRPFMREVINGLDRFGRRLKDMAETARQASEEMRKLQDQKPGDPEALRKASETLQWRLRLFEEQRRMATYVCESPALIEQRLGALARAIAKEMN